jgi:hypothetical protein
VCPVGVYLVYVSDSRTNGCISKIRGGARVIYYNQLNDGTVWLLMAYSKAKFDDLPSNILRELKNAIHQENT